LRLEAVDDWRAEMIEPVLRGMLEEMGIGTGKALQPLRVAVTGFSVSPPLFESMAALGKAKTLERLERALRRLAPS
ncbi:MAG TPA: glutamate--tRNA ligase, partial [Candidatus Methylomirabilis sp.]|nr:glutamate--tRNA ligase [Candidatus Methylomirabilis sp.]